MQRWWLVLAGVAGVVLAVLLVPQPDTGDAIPDVQVSQIEVPDLPRGTDEGPLELRPRTPATDEGETEPAEPGQLTRGQPVLPPNSMPTKPGLNPMAERFAQRRDTPEGRYAARALAPWTQVRRLVAQQNPEDDAGKELVAALEEMTTDVRTMLRDPTQVDAVEIEERQVALLSEVRSSDYNDPSVDKMVDLIEKRLEDYRTDRDGSGE